MFLTNFPCTITYIIYSERLDQYYTGYTAKEIAVRLQRHNEGWTRSTTPGIPWELKYYKSFASKSAAIKWENQIKRQKSRAFIERFIGSDENKMRE